MKLGLDAMGGDFAPDAVIEGAVDALGQLAADDRIVLIGDNTRIRDKLKSMSRSVALRDCPDHPGNRDV